MPEPVAIDDMDVELLALRDLIRVLKSLKPDARARAILLIVRRFGGTFNEQRAIAALEKQQ